MKEPWQITREELVAAARQWRAEYMPRLQGRALEDELENVARTHRKIVENALSEGKPVPAEVLAEYPDLARLAPRPPLAERIAKRTEQELARTQQQLDALEAARIVAQKRPIFQVGDTVLVMGDERIVQKVVAEKGERLYKVEGLNQLVGERQVSPPVKEELSQGKALLALGLAVGTGYLLLRRLRSSPELTEVSHG